MTSETLSAVKRKLSISWDDQQTDLRVADVIDATTAWLNSRLGFPAAHSYSSADGEPWPLFLNACLYEWSNALDAFAESYAAEIRSCRAVVLADQQPDDDGGGA